MTSTPQTTTDKMRIQKKEINNARYIQIHSSRPFACSLLGVSLTACTGEPHKKEANGEAVPVTVGRVQKVQERETISVSGTVSTPNSPASVCFLVSGKVVFVGPREGEYVKKGQVLARIDPTDSPFPQRLPLQAAAQAACKPIPRPDCRAGSS